MDNPPGAAIAFQQFSAWFGNKPVLQNVNLQIPGRERVALIGPSGSGKTTLLRTLNRLHDLDPNFRHAGTVRIGSEDIFDAHLDVSALRRRVAFISPRVASLPGTIYDNVALALRLAGEHRAARVTELVEEGLRRAWLWDELKDRLNQPGTHLPSGILRRLALARALAFGPQVLVLDEPCAGLDNVSATLLIDLLEQLSEACPVIFATNDIKQAARASEMTAFFVDGQLVECGPTDELFTRPKQALTNDFVTERF